MIRIPDSEGKRTTLKRVSQILEAYAIYIIVPLEDAKMRLKEAVDATVKCGNTLTYLPAQKEQEIRKVGTHLVSRTGRALGLSERDWSVQPFGPRPKWKKVSTSLIPSHDQMQQQVIWMSSVM